MKQWGAVLIVVALLGGLVGLAALDVAAQAKGDPAAGEALYKARCVNCHGAKGAGDGTAAQKMKDKPADWTKGAGLKGLSDQQIFDSIKKGGGAVGKSKAMPAYGSLKDEEVWNLVAYVKSLAPAS